MSEEFLYGECPEHLIEPELIKAAKGTLDYCLKRYGTGSRNIRLKWLKRDEIFYHLAKLEEGIKRLAGEPAPDLIQRGYLQTNDILGIVKSRWTRPEIPGPIFIVISCPVEKIPFVCAHEFYHARFSPAAIMSEQIEKDEASANEFAERVGREMAEAARAEAMEKWRQRYRELRKK